MSPGDRSERVEGLRDAIARIAGDGIANANFGDLGDGRGNSARVPLGGGENDLALDRALRGGLGRGALHEVVAAAPADAGTACGFALALAVRCVARRAGGPSTIVWIVEDAARAEHGAPYAPGLVAHGLDLARLVIVSTANAQDSFWAMEEALKARAGAVVADVRRLGAYDLVASRRLVLAAQKGKTPGLLVAAGAPGLADRFSSAAATRFEVKAACGALLASAGTRVPLPGRAAFAVRLARIRAGPGAGIDPDRYWPLVWDHAEAVFRDALPLAPSAAAVDRPAAQARRVA